MFKCNIYLFLSHYLKVPLRFDGHSLYKMSGPRLMLHFGRGHSCSPFRNCTQRDNLLQAITNLRFEEDGNHATIMDCAQSSSSYTLLCRNFYNDFVETSSIQDQIIWIVVFVCVVIIVCLSVNTVRIKRKLKQYQKQRDKEISHNESSTEKNEMMIKFKQQK